MARIFISYKRIDPDQTVARRLYEYLSELEHDVFFDARKISVGQRWNETIARKLAEAEFFIPIVSEAFTRSAFILAEEVRPALARLATGDLRGILPIRLDYDDEPPAELRPLIRDLQHVTWRGWYDTRAVLKTIAARLPPSESLIRGARAFDESDAAVFEKLARRDATAACLAVLERERLVLIHGVSGAGKTSFIKAGVMPRLGSSTVLEIDEGDPVANLGRAFAAGSGTIIFDQFEQVLLRLAGDEDLHGAFALALRRAIGPPAAPRVVFCLRDEFRTAFDLMLPEVARQCATYPLLPFSPAEAAVVLAELLKSGRVEHDEAFLPRLCESLAEGVPRTVLPAILQVTAQYCSNRQIVLSDRTWSAVATRSIFDAHIVNGVLRALPPTVSRLDATSTLMGLVHGDVKASFRTIREIVDERKVSAAAAEQTIALASGRARVVSHDAFTPSSEPRYRLAHDLFAAPIHRLYERALRRRSRLRFAAVAAMILALAAAAVFAAITAVRSSRDIRSMSALSDHERSFAELELKREDEAALIATRAFLSSDPAEHNAGSFLIAALHRALSRPEPVYVPDGRAALDPVPESNTIRVRSRLPSTLEMEIGPATLVNLLTGARVLLPLPPAYSSSFGVSPDGRWAAGVFDSKGGRMPAVIDLRTGRVRPWQDSEHRRLAFTADGALFVEMSGYTSQINRNDGSAVCAERLQSPGHTIDTTMLALDGKRLLTVTGQAVEVFDMTRCSRIARIPVQGRISSAVISHGGRWVAVASEVDEGITLTLCDVDSGMKRVSTRLNIVKRTLSPRVEFRIGDIDEHTLAVAGAANDERVHVWNSTSGEVTSAAVEGFDYHFDPFMASVPERRVFFAGDGGPLVTISGGPPSSIDSDPDDPHENEVGFWIRTWTVGFRQSGRVISASADVQLQRAADPRFIYIVTTDGRVYEYDLTRSIPRVAELGAEGSGISSADGTLVLAAVGEKPADAPLLRLISTRDGKSVHERLLMMHVPNATHGRLCRGRYLAAWWKEAAGGSSVQVLDLENGRALFDTPLRVGNDVADVIVDAAAGQLSILATRRDSGSGWIMRVRVRDRRVLEALPVDFLTQFPLFTDDDGSAVLSDRSHPYRTDVTFIDPHDVKKQVALSAQSDTEVWPARISLVADAAVEIDHGTRIRVRRRGAPALRMEKQRDDIAIIEEATGRRLQMPRAPKLQFQFGAVSHSGRYVALMTGEMRTNFFQVWDLHTGLPVISPVEIASPGNLWFSNDDASLLTFSRDGILRRWFIAALPAPRRTNFLRVAAEHPDDLSWVGELAAVTHARRFAGTVIEPVPPAEHAAAAARLRTRLERSSDPNARHALMEIANRRSRPGHP